MAGVDRNNPKRAASSESRYSLMEFMRDFPDDATCLEWLWVARYAHDGEHAYCENCATVRSFKRYATGQRRQSWTCTGCGQHVHPTAGTIFHKSSTSLHLWFYAMYLMTSTRCGISAKQLERELGVTYKTAWRIFHLIRNELMADDDPTQLDGAVEADEMYVGGRPRLADRRRDAQGRIKKGPSKAKTTVFGAVERDGGRVRATVIPDGERNGIAKRTREFVCTDAVLYTDEHPAYERVGREFIKHETIKHRANVYVSGDVHTQTIEGFWSLVKRGIEGTHHSVSAKHLQGYLNEYAWRYNNRDLEGPAQFGLLLLRAAGPIV